MKRNNPAAPIANLPINVISPLCYSYCYIDTLKLCILLELLYETYFSNYYMD